MGGRRRVALVLLSTAVAVCGIITACGLDVTGESQPVIEVEDVRGEAALPPTNDVDVPVDAGDAEANAPTCPTGLPGPTMVPGIEGGFCIDSREVSAAQYAAFVDASASVDASIFGFEVRPWCLVDSGFAPGAAVDTPE